MLAEAKHSPKSHKLAMTTPLTTPKHDCQGGTVHLLQWAYIDAIHCHYHLTDTISPPFLHRPSTRERSGVLHHIHGAPSHTRIQSNGQRRHPCEGGPRHNKPCARSLGGRRADPPLLPWHTRPAFHTHGG